MTPPQDDDGIKVGELARRSGLTVRTLHHYDQIGLLRPSWRSWGDHRLYTRADVQRLLAIQHLKGLGLSLAEVGQALDEAGADAGQLVREHIAAVRERMAQEQQLLERLEALQEPAASGWEDVLVAVNLQQRLTHAEPWVRVRAALEAPGAAPTSLLVGQLASDPDPSVRETLTWALAQQRDSALEPVVARLEDPDPQVRLQMAHVLSKLGDPQGIHPLLPLLHDPDMAVASKAAFAVGQLVGRAAAPERLAARDGLSAALGAPSAGDGTASSATAGGHELHQGEPQFRETVATALASLGEDALPVVRSRLVDTDPAIRAALADILGDVGGDDSIRLLLALLGDDVPEVRFAALIALGRLPGAVHQPAVRSALAQASNTDRESALLARRLLGDD